MLRGLTFEECVAIGDNLKLRKGRSVFVAAQAGFLLGVDATPEGTLAVALTDRTRFAVEIEVLAGAPLWREGRREVRHVVYGNTTHPIGADGLPLDTISEAYIVKGVRDFIAANELFFVRGKTVYAIPTGAPIPQRMLEVFRGRQVWMPMYPGHDAATTFKARVEQLRPIAEFALPIRLRRDRFSSGVHARTLADICLIYRERAECGHID